jgi:hypothetical protein
MHTCKHIYFYLDSIDDLLSKLYLFIQYLSINPIIANTVTIGITGAYIAVINMVLNNPIYSSTTSNSGS